MALGPEQVLTINRGRDVRQLPLTPEDFFVFSRIEALTGVQGPTLADVVTASGLPAAHAQVIIERLIGFGVIRAGEAEAGPTRGVARPEADPTRQRARDRRREQLEAQLRVMTRPRDASETDAPQRARTHEPSQGVEEGLPAAKSEAQKPDASDKPIVIKSILETITPVAENDPRVRPELAIGLEQQRRLLAVRDNLRRIGHFELLGIEPTDDVRALRRAYHVTSRDFHPDSFYGKDIGQFRMVLDDLFRRARASFEFLGDPARRHALVEVHEAALAEQRADLEAEQRRRAERARLEEEARAAQAAREAQEAREARELRDRERKLKIRDRVAAQRRAQARAHAEQGEAELQAGRHAAAATFFRLAHTMDPDAAEYEAKWRDCLAIARRQRAESCFERAREAQRMGHAADAARLFMEAAEAEPSLRNLTEAAAALAETDPQRAREQALAALEALLATQSQGVKIDDKTAARTHLACARAFLAAGQLHSAREQAEHAHALAASEQTRALLQAIKLA